MRFHELRTYTSLRRFNYKFNQLELNGSRYPVVAQKLSHDQTRSNTEFEYQQSLEMTPTQTG